MLFMFTPIGLFYPDSFFVNFQIAADYIYYREIHYFNLSDISGWIMNQSASVQTFVWERVAEFYIPVIMHMKNIINKSEFIPMHINAYLTVYLLKNARTIEMITAANI